MKSLTHLRIMGGRAILRSLTSTIPSLTELTLHDVDIGRNHEFFEKTPELRSLTWTAKATDLGQMARQTCVLGVQAKCPLEFGFDGLTQCCSRLEKLSVTTARCQTLHAHGLLVKLLNTTTLPALAEIELTIVTVISSNQHFYSRSEWGHVAPMYVDKFKETAATVQHARQFRSFRFSLCTMDAHTNEHNTLLSVHHTRTGLRS